MTRRTLLVPISAWLVVAALAPKATASGFQLREQSPSAQGTSFAGVSAGGPDIGSMFFNPATMTLFEGREIVAGFSYVMPKAELQDAEASRITGTPIGTQDSVPNSAKSALLPNLYAMWSLKPDLKLGLSVNAPFGMVTDYDSNFVGRYHALKSDLKVVDIAPSIAYRINPQWSVGAAFVARKVEAELTNAADFGAAVSAPPGLYDGKAGLKGDTWGYGYRLGVVFQPNEQLRIGLAHHGAMTIDLKGDASFEFGSGTPGGLIASLQAAGYVNGGASAKLNLPSTTSLGIHAELTPAISLQGEIAHTGWSRFKELRVDFDGTLADSVTNEKWRDTWFLAAGLTWKATDAWTFRTGLAYDQSAVKDEFRTPRIPDGNRTWVSLGAGYAFSKRTTIDCAYTHIFVSDGPVELKAIEDGYTPVTSPNRSRGNLSGTYKNAIDIFSVQARFTF